MQDDIYNGRPPAPDNLSEPGSSRDTAAGEEKSEGVDKSRREALRGLVKGVMGFAFLNALAAQVESRATSMLGGSCSQYTCNYTLLGGAFDCSGHYTCSSFTCQGSLVDDFECDASAGNGAFSCASVEFHCVFSFDNSDCSGAFLCIGDFIDDDR